MKSHVFQKVLIILLIYLSIGSRIYAQPVYELSLKKDVPLMAVGISGLLLTRIFEHKLPGLTQNDLDNLKPVNALDRTLSPTNYHPKVGDFSDYYIFSEIVTSLALLSIKAPKDEKFPVLVIAVEGYLLNQALTDVVKLIVKRPRPYMHDTNSPYNRYDTEGRLSFFSGHTSNAALLGFLTTSVLNQYDLLNRKHQVMIGIAIPVVMGFTRIMAGKHFFTDVFTGALTGAGLGMILPLIHQTKNGY